MTGAPQEIGKKQNAELIAEKTGCLIITTNNIMTLTITIAETIMAALTNTVITMAGGGNFYITTNLFST